jgi:hypothetical protein
MDLMDVERLPQRRRQIGDQGRGGAGIGRGSRDAVQRRLGDALARA